MLDLEESVKNNFLPNKSLNKNNIPMIHLFVNGGLEMLNICKTALLKKIPVLVFRGPKGCSDLIAGAASLNEFNETDLRIIIEESNILSKTKYQNEYEVLLRKLESDIRTHIKIEHQLKYLF